MSTRRRRARDQESAILPAIPARPLPSPAGHHPGRGLCGTRRRQPDVRSPALARTAWQLPWATRGGCQPATLRAAPSGGGRSRAPPRKRHHWLGRQRQTRAGGATSGPWGCGSGSDGRMPGRLRGRGAQCPRLLPRSLETRTGLGDDLDFSGHQGVTLLAICSLQ